MDTLTNAELTPSIRHIVTFLKSEYQFAIPKSRIRLKEKQEQEEKHRQLKSVNTFHENTNM